MVWVFFSLEGVYSSNVGLYCVLSYVIVLDNHSGSQLPQRTPSNLQAVIWLLLKVIKRSNLQVIKRSNLQVPLGTQAERRRLCWASLNLT